MIRLYPQGFFRFLSFVDRRIDFLVDTISPKENSVTSISKTQFSLVLSLRFVASL